MKIALLAHNSGVYGANRSLLDRADGIRSFGTEPLVFIPERGGIEYEFSKRKIPVEVMSYEPWMAARRQRLWAPVRILANKRALLPLSKRIRSFGADLVHSNSSVISIGIEVARRLDIPHIWHLREFADLQFGMKYDLGSLYSRRMLATSNAYIAVSRSVKEYLLPLEVQPRCTVIYNGVLWSWQMEQLHDEYMHRLPNPGPVFALVGRISPAKGQEQAIRAMALIGKTHNARLALVGSGGPRYMSKLQRLCRTLDVEDRIEFRGFLDDPYPSFLEADVALVCSRHEGMGRVTAEAMSIGIPVVGYDSTGTAELIKHNKTGLLYNGTVEDLAKCMVRLIEDRTSADTLASRAWQFARKQFTIETYCERVYKVYRETLE
jgi:glycosyltransferase involved in cell wall biosynthesis